MFAQIDFIDSPDQNQQKILVFTIPALVLTSLGYKLYAN